MPDPADLPNELFIMVLDLALQDEFDFQRLCGLSFLNLCWHAVVLGRIYSEWTFNGAKQPFMTLWKYLRTMRRNPNLAAMVRTLNIGNWGFFDHAYTPGRGNALPWEELELVKRAIHDAGIGHLESGILESLANRDRRPLMALLLTSLPNLSTLFAHVPRSDPVLWLVLEQVITRQTYKSLSPSTSSSKRDSDNDSEDLDDDRRDEELQARGKSGSLRFDGLWPILHLQSLQKLNLYDVDPDHSSTLLGPSAGASPFESLDLVVSSGYLCTIPDIQAFIRLPKTLRNFSFYVKVDILDDPDMSMITGPGIWNGLLAHKLSLETIDIYYDGFMSASRGQLGLLRDFPSLKHISVQLETLLGDCDEDSPEIPLLLKETLPSTLETLTIYDNDGFNVLADLPTQLQGMVSPDFPCLKGIFLEAGPGLYDHKNECIKASYQAVERKCNENGVEYEIQEPHQLKHGGLRRDLWAKMREDGNERAEWFGVAPKKFRDLEELILCPAKEGKEEEDDDDDCDGLW